MPVVNKEDYELIPFVHYRSFWDKMGALMRGEVLLIRSYERTTESDVLVKLDTKKHVITKISHDLVETEKDPRNWFLYNVGLNDLSLHTVLKYSEDIVNHTNRFNINDTVKYVSRSGKEDSALIEEVWQSKVDPAFYVYKLSRDLDLYEQEELTPV